MKELKEKAQTLIDQYSPELAGKGIKLLLSKRYFENTVGQRWGATGAGSILNEIDRIRDRKREKENGYNYQKNRYHCIVISVIPNDKNILRCENCREYAVVIKKVERPHIGEEPRRITYKEDKILAKIEKQILKILKKAEKMTPEKLSKDNFFDALRYSILIRYGYKKNFLGKSRFAWEMIFLAVFCVCVFGCLFVAWLFSK